MSQLFRGGTHTILPDFFAMDSLKGEGLLTLYFTPHNILEDIKFYLLVHNTVNFVVSDGGYMVA